MSSKHQPPHTVPPHKPTDRHIISLYESRDERAIALTAEQFGDCCYAVAYNILSNREDAEECVNDTYLAAWNTIPPAKPASLRGFLIRITRNLALDRYKFQHREKRGGGQVPLVLEELAEVVSDENNVAEDYARRELLEAISRFLIGCSSRDRNVFVDRYVRMDTTADIADRYGIKEAQALLILSRTRKKLKLYLEKEGYTL